MNIWDECFERFDFKGRLNNAGSKLTERKVYHIGSGPPLLLMHELPGLSEDTFQLAKTYSKHFTVYLPLLTGKVGDKKLGKLSLGLQSLRILCLNREIHLLKAKSSSPITLWLRDLCNHIRSQSDYNGVGVLGMCLTGNFAMTLMADDAVLGAVSAQPSLPARPHSALHMSDSDIKNTSNRLDDLGHYMHAYRFKSDVICKAEKFSAIDKTFNTAERERVRIKQLEVTAEDENLHSVLVYSFGAGGDKTKQVYDETVEYFKKSFELFG